VQRSLTTLVLFLVLIGATPARGQETERKMLDASEVPIEAARTDGFAPKGWRIHKRAAGDLNGDGRSDVAMILFDRALDDASPRSGDVPAPALLIVLATDHGRWRRAGVNTKLIFADDSGFAPLNVRIINGLVIVNQELLSNITANTLDYSYTDRFRYDSAADRFMLIGEDDANTHRDAVADGIRVSDNYLTGERILTRMHAVRGKYVSETNIARRIERRRVFLEDLGAEDIDFEKLWDEFSRPGSPITHRTAR